MGDDYTDHEIVPHLVVGLDGTVKETMILLPPREMRTVPMHYGHAPHKPSPDDLTVLSCSCGWRSAELSCGQVHDLGLPWYCDRCGRQNLHFIRFHPSERGQ